METKQKEVITFWWRYRSFPPLNDLFSLKILKVFRYLSHELLAAVTQKERNLARESSDRLPLCVF